MPAMEAKRYTARGRSACAPAGASPGPKSGWTMAAVPARTATIVATMTARVRSSRTETSTAEVAMGSMSSSAFSSCSGRTSGMTKRATATAPIVRAPSRSRRRSLEAAFGVATTR